MAVLAIDFDNTLFEETADGEVRMVEGAREAMLELRRLGHRLLIHTCRTTVASEIGDLAEEIRWIEGTLVSFGIPFDEIYAGDKLIADAYVDDRAVAFRGDWGDTLDALGSHLEARRRRRSEAG